MIWATVSSWSCFCWLYRASPSLAAKNIINLISTLTTWWCPCVELCLVLEESLLWPVHSQGTLKSLLQHHSSKASILQHSAFFRVQLSQNSVSLCPASFCTPRPYLPVTPGTSWLLVLHFTPLGWQGHLFLVLVLNGLVEISKYSLKPLHFQVCGIVWFSE